MAKPRSDTDWSAYSSSGWTTKRAGFPVFVSDRKWEHSEVRHRRSIFPHFWFVSKSGWLPCLLLFYPACFLSSFEFVCFLCWIPHHGQIAFWNASLSPVKICHSTGEAEASRSEIEGYHHLGDQPGAMHGSKEIHGFGLLWLCYLRGQGERRLRLLLISSSDFFFILLLYSPISVLYSDSLFFLYSLCTPTKSFRHYKICSVVTLYFSSVSSWTLSCFLKFFHLKAIIKTF